MLTVEECRTLIDGADKYSDQEICEIRDTLYGLAQLAFEVWEKKKQAATDGKS